MVTEQTLRLIIPNVWYKAQIGDNAFVIIMFTDDGWVKYSHGCFPITSFTYQQLADELKKYHNITQIFVDDCYCESSTTTLQDIIW